MKDNLNKVYALNSLDKNTAGEWELKGMLLFQEKEHADRFMEICANARERDKRGLYEERGWVTVNDWLGNRIQSQKSFFTRDALPLWTE